MLKIFLSWSGDASRQCAELLRDKLPYFNASIDPFVSSEDIRKGDRGLEKIAEELEGSQFGIVCVTPANRGAPWVNFEAGALSKQVKTGRVMVFLLLGATVKDLLGTPLQPFQATLADSRSDVLKMIKDINRECDPTNSESRIEDIFDKYWPELQDNLNNIARISQEADGATVPRRSNEDVLDEILSNIRIQIARITDLETAVSALRSRRRVAFDGIHSADLPEETQQVTRAAGPDVSQE
ncbi:toll/interleukin-1 receptor domain-containing protein [Streptomyces griseorubiginosus]|uniref:toll/interleukin-1 receptor domain-containing protein n=1 Tax=Streptomyces griseorubiginosus TaxID=67304 RepID=UPI0036BC79D7